MKIGIALILLIFAVTAVPAQRRRATSKRIPSTVPVKEGTDIREAGEKLDAGVVSGRTYTNPKLHFSVTFPDPWLIPGPDFDEYMRSKGVDLHTVNDQALGTAAKKEFRNNVTVLLTAYRSMPGTVDNAFVIIAAEDLSQKPQIKDAVDYLDAVRQSLLAAKLPAGFKIGETDAEQLGPMQFAFLDTSSGRQKRRLYATVRENYAVLFTVSYFSDSDLATARKVLETGDFAWRPPEIPQD